MRQSWRDYFVNVSGIVFVIDSSDRSRFRESATELAALFEDPILNSVPFLILANKVDVAGHATFSEILEAFNFENLCYGEVRDFEGNRPIHLLMVSVRQRFGFMDGLKWLTAVVTREVGGERLGWAGE